MMNVKDNKYHGVAIQPFRLSKLNKIGFSIFLNLNMNCQISC